MTMRMPTLRPFGEGCTSGEEIDICTRSIRRGSGHGHRYLSASPSKKSVRRLKMNVRRLLASGNHAPWDEVCEELNRVLYGWSNYFGYGTRSQMFRAVDHFVYERARDFLARRHKVAGRGTRRFSLEVVYGNLGLTRLERLPCRAPPCA